MNVSQQLAEQTHMRFKSFRSAHHPANSKQALLTFKGDVYRGVDADTLSAEDLEYAQQRLRILSGLYGILRPLDLIQPYRLEMGTALKSSKGKNLYEFWGDTLALRLNKELKESGCEHIVNLASNEYAKSINRKRLNSKIIDVQFKEFRGDKLAFLSFNAKKARGVMARFIIDNRLTDADSLKAFSEDGYYFAKEYSSESSWLFVR